MKKHTLMLAAMLATTQAQAAFFSGNDLYERLQSTSTMERTGGIGYILGVFDATHKILHCSPDTVTAGQVADLVQAVLKITPEVRHQSADLIVRVTLSTTWPCEKAGKTQSKSLTNL